MKNTYLLSILLLTSSLYACKVKCNSNPGFCLNYDGFDSVEKSVAILEVYQKSTNFTVREQVYQLADTYKVSNDTTYQQYFQLDVNHDYIVNLPLAKRIFKIRDLTYHQISGPYPGSDWTCDNAASWYVNDVAHGFGGVEPEKHGYDQCATIYLYKSYPNRR
ncbi:MAG: hypothetical protein ACTHJ0_09695 [Flavipsychrobacter sp.]